MKSLYTSLSLKKLIAPLVFIFFFLTLTNNVNSQSSPTLDLNSISPPAYTVGCGCVSPGIINGTTVSVTNIANPITDPFTQVNDCAPVFYQWQSSVNGTSGWTDIPDPLLTGYGQTEDFNPGQVCATVYYRRIAGAFCDLPSPCEAYTVSSKVKITLTTLPQIYTLSGAGTVCPGILSTLTLNGSETGVRYFFYENGILLDSSITGTGSSLTWDVTHNDCNTAYTYTVRAKIIATGCDIWMTGSPVITWQDINAPTLGTPWVQVGTINSCQPSQQVAFSNFVPANALLGWTDNCVSNSLLTVDLDSAVVSGGNCTWTVTYYYQVKDPCLNPAPGSYSYSGGNTELPVGVPADGGSTVSCLASAVAPSVPTTVYDVCGTPLTGVLTNMIDIPATITCNGTREYTYTFTSCPGYSLDWKYTYTITYSGGLQAPTYGYSTVSCPAEAVDPGAPAPITDACGRIVNAVLVGSTTPPACNGIVEWTYRYTACDGVTTADWMYTYTINYSGGLTPPTSTVATVSCPAEAVDPGAPAPIFDACGRTVNATFVGVTYLPSILTCNGTVEWKYKYTACDNQTEVYWTKTYTVLYSGGLTAPASTSSTVSCPSEAVDPGAPAPIIDACGRTVNAVLVGNSSIPNCNGQVVWTYRYTACDNQTTADWTHTYTITYSGGLTAPANGSSTVSCPAMAGNPGAPAYIYDACGRMVEATLVGSVSTPASLDCNGEVVWTYRYTACDGTTTADWTYTYTVLYSGGLVAPTNGASTVSCPAQAIDPGAPMYIYDACYRMVNPVLVGSVSTPASLTCNGEVVWTYRYTACDGTTTADWTYTYTVLYSGGLIPPTSTIATVSCPAEAIDPGAPAPIMDACGRTVDATFVGVTYLPSILTCNGTVEWKYKYTACDNVTEVFWTKTYTVLYSGGLTAPASTSSTVTCPALAVDPGAPAPILDACGRTVNAVLVGSSTVPDCNGQVVWTYKYTACDDQTVVYWTHTYTITYAGALTPPTNGSSTVSCPADAVDPGAPAAILDACGRTVNAVLVGHSTIPSCNGQVVWTYTYLACDGTTYADWTYTYTITYSGGLTPPSNGSSTVSCPAEAVDPGVPMYIYDACGRMVNAVLVGSTPAPLCDGQVVWTYRYTACDLSTADWTYTYTIHDGTPPAFLAPPAITIYTDATCTYNALPGVTGNPSLLSDNCTPALNLIVSYTDATVPGFCPGSFDITRTWKVEDCVGNATTQTQLIHVSDNIDPIIVPGGPFVRCATTTYTTYTTIGTEFDLSYSDNCAVNEVNYSFSGATTSTMPYTSLAGVVFNAGLTTVHLVVSDCAENTVTYDYTITINPRPTIDLHGDTAICCNTLATYCDLSAYPGDNMKYEWTMAGGIFISGENTPCVQVKWNCDCTEGWIRLKKTNLLTGCVTISAPFHVTIYPEPTPIIMGPTTVYTNATGTHYWLANCNPLHSFSWSVEGGDIIAGDGTCEIWVNWNWPYCDTCGTVCVTETSLNLCEGSACIQVNQIPVPGAFTLKGQLTYDNASSTPLNGVTVKLLQGGVVKATTLTYSAIDETDPNNPFEVPGYYEFSGLNPGTYTLNATTTKAWGGVNATDALLIKLHAISSPLLTGLPLVAGDVNLSSVANATDALLVQLRTVGRVGSFAAGNWVFGTSAITLSGNTTYNFVALATGDVNKSYVPEVGYKAIVYTNLQKEGVIQANGQEIEIPIRINDVFSLGAVTLDLSYDQNLVEVTDITSQLSGFEYKINNGKIMLAWANPVPVSLQANDVLLTLKVIAKGAINISSDIFSMSDKSEFADGSGNILAFNLLKVNGIQSDSKTNDISVYPNPFQNNAEINYNIVEAGNVKIALYNVVGQRTEVLVNEFKNIGNYKFNLNTSDLPSGVYSCEIIINGQTSDYKKVIKLVRTK